MRASYARAAGAAALTGIIATAAPAAAQDHDHAAMGHDMSGSQAGHDMFMHRIGAWNVLGMAQIFPAVSTGFSTGTTYDGGANDAVTTTEFYATQPVIMFNLESPGSRFVLRTTLNFEGITQEDGELTFGGWGEGFIDKRHPHTLLHEAMLSWNMFDVAGGDFSLSAGKGFAPYGTDDPMARPVLKYPTNHHLSQILERFTVNAVYRTGPWSVEAGVFGGSEPTGPYDFSNIESFGNSWSARLARRFGGVGTMAPWELSASYGYVVEEHHDEEVATSLMNVALRHDAALGAGRLYTLVEASRSDPEDDDGYFSVLGEAQLTRGVHRPYARLEIATRPEYARGEPGTDEFFRYDHDSHAIGATRWTIATVGYGVTATALPYSARPFVELQYNQVANDRGDVAATELFGTSSFFAASAGVRLFFGGGPMRMGSYGVLDAMTDMMR